MSFSMYEYYKPKSVPSDNLSFNGNSVNINAENIGKRSQSSNKSPIEKPIELIEEIFGKYYDEADKCHTIKRFTWKNQNKIQVQVINFGARITSMKVPDRKGVIEDIVLGFDDLAGYIYHRDHYFGATIGRTSHKLKNPVFMLGQEKVKLKCRNGGSFGFDRQVFNTFINKNQVIMTHLSPNLTGGYPGDLLVQIKFELSNKNEFRIEMRAQTTKPTIINLSNLLYFNLAGHQAGPDHIYKHSLTLNCNCFTQLDESGLPTGQICNVLNTPFDFQIPVSLGKVMGLQPHDGFDHNLCVNRGMYQESCFVAMGNPPSPILANLGEEVVISSIISALPFEMYVFWLFQKGRVFHPPSGRMLEIYSNQPGVQFRTGNNFGTGYILTMDEILSKSKTAPEPQNLTDQEKLMSLLKKICNQISQLLNLDRDNNFNEIQELIVKIRNGPHMPEKDESGMFNIELTPLQWEYLNCILLTPCSPEDEEMYQEIKQLITTILNDAEVLNNGRQDSSYYLKKQSSLAYLSDYMKKVKSLEQAKLNVEKKNRGINVKNEIPKWYNTSEKIRGKDRTVYRNHGGIAIQTQNYPSSINFSSFPSCVLNPGEVYEHNLTYRFWIRAGNPQKWIRRNMSEIKRKESAKI